MLERVREEKKSRLQLKDNLNMSSTSERAFSRWVGSELGRSSWFGRPKGWSEMHKTESGASHRGSSANTTEEKKNEGAASTLTGQDRVRNADKKEGDYATPANNSGTSGNHREGGFKKLTEEEYQRRQEKGICFRCDEKFTPGHRCKNKQLNVLILSEEAENELEAIANELSLEAKKSDKTMALSLTAMVGIFGAKSMRLKGDNRWSRNHGFNILWCYPQFHFSGDSARIGNQGRQGSTFYCSNGGWV